MAATERPKRVVVVDADNPLVEINGEFFWREDHEEILARERDSAYRRGYDDAVRDGAASSRAPVVVTVRRRSWVRRLIVRALLVWLGLTLALMAIGWVTQGRFSTTLTSASYPQAS